MSKPDDNATTGFKSLFTMVIDAKSSKTGTHPAASEDVSNALFDDFEMRNGHFKHKLGYSLDDAIDNLRATRPHLFGRDDTVSKATKTAKEAVKGMNPHQMLEYANSQAAKKRQ